MAEMINTEAGTASTITNSISNYKDLDLIGNGAYGTVYKARDIVSNCHVALKKIKVNLSEDGGMPISTLREIALLKQIDVYEHPNIVRLLDICPGQRFEEQKQLILFLVFEHMEMDLSHFIDRCPPSGIEPCRRRDLMFQLMSGVDFLHSHRIVHRDLKPQNILIGNNLTLKLADFGLAKVYGFEMQLTSVVVTLWYRSPEILLGLPYDTSLDIWSCGCIMAELLKLHPLFPGSNEGDQLNQIFKILGTPPEGEWPQKTSISKNSFPKSEPKDLTKVVPELCDLSKDMLERMLKFTPRERITALEALNHPYFKDFGYKPLKLQSSPNISKPSTSNTSSNDSGSSMDSAPEK